MQFFLFLPPLAAPPAARRSLCLAYLFPLSVPKTYNLAVMLSTAYQIQHIRFISQLNANNTVQTLFERHHSLSLRPLGTVLLGIYCFRCAASLQKTFSFQLQTFPHIFPGKFESRCGNFQHHAAGRSESNGRRRPSPGADRHENAAGIHLSERTRAIERIN